MARSLCRPEEKRRIPESEIRNRKFYIFRTPIIPGLPFVPKGEQVQPAPADARITLNPGDIELMKDTSEIPAIAEPWFVAFNAKISLRPVMNSQDLAKGGPAIGKAAKQYGK